MRVTKRLAVLLLSVSLLCIVLLSLTVAVGAIWAKTVPNSDLKDEVFHIGVTDRTTRLYCYDENGEAKELVDDRVSGYQNSLFCPLSEMPENLKNAFIAIEDKRYYEHGGIDWLRTLSAARGYITGRGRVDFGGSTITQQLVKNLTGESRKSVTRKVGELMRAADLERKMSKNDILEQYLNVVNLAQNCYGVKTAANAYFSKEPSELSLAECATIAAITNNPTKYDPIKHPETNKVRRDLILGEMLAQGMIDEGAYNEAVSSPTVLAVNERAMTGRVNSWYADMAISDVIAALVREKNYSEAEASQLVYGGGLKIYLAMDERLQAAVSALYEDASNFPTHKDGRKAESAVLMIDPKNGDILAVAGAVGKKSSNRIQSYAINTRRPSGSVIKPLSVYAPALERGLITYGTVFDDIPLSFRKNGAPWPRNSPDLYRGLTTVNTALAHSVNTVAVSVLNRLGRREAFRFLSEELGFYSLRAGEDMGTAALALGQQSRGVTLREVVGAYTALANGGVYEGTRSYYKVLDSKGELLLTTAPVEKRVISEENACIMTMMLRKAVSDGTGREVTVRNLVDVAGKTGTSTNNCDKWFVGYTPELLTGVWYGYEYPESVADVRGNHALAIWDAVMQQALQLREVRERQFYTHENVVAVRYCRDSGALLGEACCHDPRGDRSEIGYFKRGTEPQHYCSCHVLIDYCNHGGVATGDCPKEECHQTALLRVWRSFPRQIKVLDAQYSYGGANLEKGQNLSTNEPYYAKKYNSEKNFGIEMGLVPYNRSCISHTADPFWRRRITLG